MCSWLKISFKGFEWGDHSTNSNESRRLCNINIGEKVGPSYQSHYKHTKEEHAGFSAERITKTEFTYLYSISLSITTLNFFYVLFS